MRHLTILNISIVAFSCAALGGCANSYRASTAEPVLVHTDSDAATLLAQNPYQATHVKIGARWFPRCQQFVSLGSRTDVSTACMTDAEIREIADRSNAQQQEFSQRTGAIGYGQGGS